MSERNCRVFQAFNIEEGTQKWNDWHWQYRNRICDAKGLSRVLDISDAEKNEITTCLDRFRMAITPYYASLIDPFNLCDPVRLQAVPSIRETIVHPWEMNDPLDEERISPVTNIVHRYPDRVLFLVTKRCAVYCRHCTRRRLVGEEDSSISDEEIEAALEYIRSKPSIRDVLVSGGDPLTLSDGRLQVILSQLREIEHVEIIRIGTRVPVTMPMRITSELLTMLKKYQPIWINTHFNHPIELTDDSIQACAQIVDAGVPLGNQSVLLRGINDSVDIIKELMLKLIKARIRPYYLYQCDLNEGLEHFRTDVRTGVSIIRNLIGNISGFAIPTFVIDAPGGGGKIPISPDFLISIDNENAIMENYLGEIFHYPQPL
ncbi:MAG: lysine 2,3-aminomutase [Oscillospiraceae bacterium]|nr:lysine 2,3-aminomutase [Oscillospiraceae bacterium]